MMFVKKGETIKLEILKELENGQRNKSKIFTNVVDNLGVPRPMVRRCSRELIAELSDKVKILTSDLERVKNEW